MKSQFRRLILSATLPLAVFSLPALRASDHADGPTVAGDQAADLADCYMFVDPSDPSKMVIINTVRGFIVPGEAVNFVIFDSTIRYTFQVENNDDAKPDGFCEVSFSEKIANDAGVAQPQTATVTFSGAAFDGLKGKYTGITMNPGLGTLPPPNYFPNPAQKLKDSSGTEIPVDFFAGETDDPFFFDIPGFARFRNKVLAGDATAATELLRGRDTFAGYNVLTIAFRVPISLLVNTKKGGSANTTKFGVNVLAERATERTSNGQKFSTGPFKTVDREGLPALNALLVPLNLKNAYNGATTIDDANGEFAGAIVGTLKALGTSQANIDLLAGLAVVKGDILRVDTAKPGGFPNGRLPADDVVKTYLTIISNANESQTTLDDSVPSNERPFATVFPYLGLPHQPRLPGADDQTQN